jgi:hypothetical protein
MFNNPMGASNQPYEIKSKPNSNSVERLDEALNDFDEFIPVQNTGYMLSHAQADQRSRQQQVSSRLNNIISSSTAGGYNPMSTNSQVPKSTRASNKKLMELPRFNTVDHTSQHTHLAQSKFWFILIAV